MKNRIKNNEKRIEMNIIDNSSIIAENSGLEKENSSLEKIQEKIKWTAYNIDIYIDNSTRVYGYNSEHKFCLTNLKSVNGKIDFNNLNYHIDFYIRLDKERIEENRKSSMKERVREAKRAIELLEQSPYRYSIDSWKDIPEINIDFETHSDCYLSFQTVIDLFEENKTREKNESDKIDIQKNLLSGYLAKLYHNGGQINIDYRTVNPEIRVAYNGDDRVYYYDSISLAIDDYIAESDIIDIQKEQKEKEESEKEDKAKKEVLDHLEYNGLEWYIDNGKINIEPVSNDNYVYDSWQNALDNQDDYCC